MVIPFITKVRVYYSQCSESTVPQMLFVFLQILCYLTVEQLSLTNNYELGPCQGRLHWELVCDGVLGNHTGYSELAKQPGRLPLSEWEWNDPVPYLPFRAQIHQLVLPGLQARLSSANVSLTWLMWV